MQTVNYMDSLFAVSSLHLLSSSYSVSLDMKGCICHLVKCRYTRSYPRARYMLGSNWLAVVLTLIHYNIVLNLFIFRPNHTVIGNEMSGITSTFLNVLSQIKQISVIFTHLKLWIAIARHNFKWVKI